MRSRSLPAGFALAAILGVSLTTVSMPARAGEPSAGPGPAAEAPASGAPSTTPAPAGGAPAVGGGAAPGTAAAGSATAPAGGPMLGPATNSAAKLLRTSGLIRNASVEPPAKKASGDPSQTRAGGEARVVSDHSRGQIHAKRGARFFDEVNVPNRKIENISASKKEEWRPHCITSSTHPFYVGEHPKKI